MCRFMVEELDIVGIDIGEGSDFAVQHLIECRNGL